MFQILVCLTFSAFASPDVEALQQTKPDRLDSLLAVANLTDSSPENIQTLILVAEQMNRMGRLDESLTYSIKARGLAEKTNNQKGVGNALMASAGSYIKKGTHQAGIADLDEATKIFTSQNDLIGLGRVNMLRGELYESLSDQPKAYANQLKALKYFKEGKSIEGEIFATNGLGIIGYRTGNYELAVMHHLRALTLIDSLRLHPVKNQLPGFSLVGAAASALNDLGVIYDRLEDYDQALQYYNRSYELLEHEKLWRFVAKTESNIAGVLIRMNALSDARVHLMKATRLYGTLQESPSVYLLTNYGSYYTLAGKYDSAEFYFNKAMRVSRELNNAEGKLMALEGLSNLYLITHQLQKSAEQLSQAIQTAHEIDSKPWLMGLYLAQSKLDSARGDYRASLASFKLHYNLKDSLDKHAKIEQISYLQSFMKPENEPMPVRDQQVTTSFITNIPVMLIIGSLAIFGMITLFSMLYRLRLSIRKQDHLH